jgi:predicted AlkP superfamily pyrophosphatase or phosphodiesterase
VKRCLLALLAGAALGVAQLPTAAAAERGSRPRLAVVLVVDQFRKDYLERFGDLFLPAGSSGSDVGGFRYLTERGAQFPSARYRHFPLFTGPGHAVVLTGGYPYKTGILANDWFSKALNRPVYCVEDPGAKVIGAPAGSTAKPMSPANLRSSTVGDELKLATGRAAKVVTLALKDRAAILLGGRLTDATVWFDDSTGTWVSSDAYCRNDVLPEWVAAVNQRKLPRAAFGKEWQSDPSEAALARTWTPRLRKPLNVPYGLGAAFPHRIDGGLAAPGLNFYRAFTSSPYANEYVLETARQAVMAEHLGQDAVPDLLAINLSTNDYVGHAFGPNSPEALDVTVRTDRQLAEFFRFLDRTVPGGLGRVTLALTADHGVSPVPEYLQSVGFRSGRILDADLEKAADDELDSRFGKQDWVSKYVEPYLYLNDAAIRASGADAELLQRVAARAIQSVDGIYAAYPRTQVEEGRLGTTDLAGRLYKGFYPKLAGDVLVVMEQFWFTEETPQRSNTTHGSPYAYDTEVPLLLAGAGVRPGVYRSEACPGDLAPTLCALLGIGLPSACDGMSLQRALR